MASSDSLESSNLVIRWAIENGVGYVIIKLIQFVRSSRVDLIARECVGGKLCGQLLIGGCCWWRDSG